eukprot:1385137-Karenia_brevis.AAC.1
MIGHLQKSKRCRDFYVACVPPLSEEERAHEDERAREESRLLWAGGWRANKCLLPSLILDGPLPCRAEEFGIGHALRLRAPPAS